MKKASSLLLTILIMAALLAIAIGVSKLTLGEIKLIQDVPKSLFAYYAAEAGAEWATYQYRLNSTVSNVNSCSVNLDNGSSYGIEVSGTIIKSIGCYQDIRRAIEISF
ncbi:MAG: hypothetical protein ABIH51_02445 [Patescibacteria group bacterium]